MESRNLVVNWLFSPGDEKNFSNPEFNDSGWKPLSIFANWNDDKLYKDYRGIAWYRLHLTFEEKGQYGLFFAKTEAGVQFYFNGKPIYQNREDLGDVKNFQTNKGRPDFVLIPEGEIREGKNVLAIRTGYLDYFTGISSVFYIGKAESIKKMFISYFFRNIFLISISFFLALFFILFYLFRKSETYFLFYGGMSFFLGCWILGYSCISINVFDNYLFYILVTYCGAIFTSPFLLLFLHSFLNIRHSLFIKGLYVSFIVFFLLLIGNYMYAGNIRFFNQYIYNIFNSVNLLVPVSALVISGIGFYRKRKYAVFIFSGVLVYSVFIFITILHFLNIISGAVLIVDGLFVLTIVMAIVLASRFAQVHTDLETAHGELTVLDKMKDEFLATTSHELRTPLHGIIGLTDSMLSGIEKKLSLEHEQDVELIRNSAQRLNGLVDEILDFSKLRAGRADLYLEKIDLKQIIPSVTSIIQGLVGKKQIKIVHNVGEDVPVITGDRHRVEQVLLNLLSNAVKFTNEGFITVAAHGADGGVSVAVHDSGIGMSRSDLKRIWNPYEQAQESDRRTGEGTGLGLAICRHLVELHGGTIDAESSKGKGSTFTFWLPGTPKDSIFGIRRKTLEVAEKLPPVALPPDIDLKAAGAPSVPGLEKSDELIMVVDDDPINLQILERLLVREGYRVKTFSNGSDALASIENELPHLILLDLMLPEMSGYDIMLKVRQHFQHDFIPVIMITARNQVEDMVKGFIFGCNDYLSKPFNQQELLVRVQNQLVMKNFLDTDKKLYPEDFDEESLLQRSRIFQETVNTLKDWEGIISKDLDMSKAFLDSLMGVHVNRSDIDIHVVHDPLLAIGGDLYLVHSLVDGRVRLFLADATGHGINASLNCITIMSEYNLLRDMELSPAEILFRLNNRFIQISEDQHIVFTCCIVDIFLERQELEIASAGHPHQVVVSPGGELHLCRPRGPIIGLAEDAPYDTMTVSFAPASMLGLYSDGLIENFAEAKHDRHDIHNEEFFYQVMLDNHGAPDMTEASKKIISTMKGKGRRKRIDDDDDLTLILLKYSGLLNQEP